MLGRAAVAADAVVHGPAILNQMDTTTLVPPGWQARLASVRRIDPVTALAARNETDTP